VLGSNRVDDLNPYEFGGGAGDGICPFFFLKGDRTNGSSLNYGNERETETERTKTVVENMLLVLDNNPMQRTKEVGI
jgi:hypothetical protein